MFAGKVKPRNLGTVTDAPTQNYAFYYKAGAREKRRRTRENHEFTNI